MVPPLKEMIKVNDHPCMQGRREIGILWAEGTKPQKWGRFAFFLGGWRRDEDFNDVIGEEVGPDLFFG